jgi:acylphosphatase
MKEANKIGVTGFIQNDSSGTVSGEAQGDDTKISELLKIIQQGPPSAEVTGVEKNEISTKEGESKFRQLR